MKTNIEQKTNDLLTIDPSAYFDVDKKQLFYWSEREEDIAIDQEDTPVNRYALVRKDNGKLYIWYMSPNGTAHWVQASGDFLDQ